MWTVGRFGRLFGVAEGRRSPAQMQPYPIRTPEPDDPPWWGGHPCSKTVRTVQLSNQPTSPSEEMKEIKRHG
jgi:hypothetical protein